MIPIGTIRGGHLCGFEPLARNRFVRKPSFIRPELDQFKTAQHVDH